MTTAELKEYLGMVVQMEKEVDTQERLCQELNHKEAEYSEKITHIANTMEKIEKPHKPSRGQTYREAAKYKICMGIVMLVGFLTLYFIASILIEHHLDQNILADILALAAFIDVVWGSIRLLTGIGDYLAAPEKDNKAYSNEARAYREQYNAYEIAQGNNQTRTTRIRQLESKKRVAEGYRQAVENALVTSRQNLETMYSYDVIFSKYRSYTMVSSIYEYICAGRCATLEGHEGAYNILELEIRLDYIITQLDDVLRDLSAIRANQYTLYSCLKKANQKIDTLMQEESRIADAMQSLGAQSHEMNRHLGELQHSSELANYLAECNQRELHYMNRMNYLAGHYDNPYGNYAPV